ncbi:hypothetical protein SAMN04489729_1547 [Amycolatopsis lurida]|nr:hypothetical protein SAMN04489729_1547 [Amycolatopsis lurida]
MGSDMAAEVCRSSKIVAPKVWAEPVATSAGEAGSRVESSLTSFHHAVSAWPWSIVILAGA